ncbi:acetylcholine receptor subunit beta-like, partial [Leucoraja erinacea]|uniref:acetylcholine receptor subunit beta-like n=1 Tax=Leucoraja erinaceus TaxID=7782 RepID=UPI002457A81C
LKDNTRLGLGVQPDRLLSEMRWLMNDIGQHAVLPPDLKSAVEAIKYIAQELSEQEEFDELRKDWQYVAMVVDRLFLFIFISFTTIGTLTIFLDATYNVPPTDPFYDPYS